MTVEYGDLAGLDFAAVSPEEFARIVKSAPGRQIKEFMRGPDRARVLDEVFGRFETRFRPTAADGVKALVRWRVTGADGAEPDVYETDIAGGACTLAKGATDRRPRLTLTLAETEFLKLVSGNASGPVLFMTRKLKVEGDIGLAAGLTKYFDIPKA
ncbi:acyl-CoA synthase [Mangrovactinospora gilvigrisea]|uniref:Acyl-CoA synthase n=1 Tax=Mangrovactinospora gilvigrisea TaxID=1428644 RepID=A0A1J7BKJ9_9ACTN|nr:SCP2 sterol-binding domain-containing protein [Mangrovactinospora gilvigrisea]OIV39166.1 acyl-CoA synthase [Mangrovactinospora gilvigrisea]